MSLTQIPYLSYCLSINKLIIMNYRIRKWCKEDATELTKIMNDIHVWAKLSDHTPFPYTKEDANTYINESLNNDKVFGYAVESEEKLVGAVKFKVLRSPYATTAVLNFWIENDKWEEGIMPEAVADLTRSIFFHQPVIKVMAPVIGTDEVRTELLTSAGFVHEATLKKAILKTGKVLDLHIYSITE